jgi:hypothetical protein
LPAPDFRFKVDKPTEEAGGLDEYNWPWAICERLDYIAATLHQLTEILEGGRETRTQLHSEEAVKSDSDERL